MAENPRAAIVEDFKERLSRVKVAVIADYKGLTVRELEGFRRDLLEKGAQLRILKNTLARRALVESELPGCEDVLKGQIAFILGYDDAVGGPQAAKGFAKGHEEFRILAGIFEGELVDAGVIEQLASLPNKDTLRAKLLMLMWSPQVKLLRLLGAVPQEFLGTLQSLAEKVKESSPEQQEAKD
jgi:large subunit ribosomal protein L10